jgi:hypothetical protein
MAEQIIATTTRSHTIEVVNGYLIIRGEPEMLAPDEVEQLLDALLITSDSVSRWLATREQQSLSA